MNSLIYASPGSQRGFKPCSRTYRFTVQQAIRRQDWNTVESLFRQTHRLMWRLDPSGTFYIHNVYPDQQMSVANYQHLNNLPGPQITVALLDQQCGGPLVPFANLQAMRGPQANAMTLASKKMAELQQESYTNATQNGYDIDAVKGRAVYAPSPYIQHQDAETGLYVPDNPLHTAGQSSGPCLPDGTCADGLECQANQCVIPVAARTCPPFQYQITIPGSEDVISNLSNRRTRKIKKYSRVGSENYDSCIPEIGHTAMRWVEDPRVRQYIGLVFNVIQLPVAEWIEASRTRHIFSDPGTLAPYFLQDRNGQIYRIYKLYSAYTPVI